MGEIELRITRNDWFSVFLIGGTFSTLLSTLSYYILRLPWSDGALFGLFLGFFITLFSMLFITSMNRYLLPKLPKSWWNLIAAIFSFLSGFFGTLCTYFLLIQNGIATVVLVQNHPLISSVIVGILTYLIGALIYRFVKIRNEKEHIDKLFIESRVRSLETQLNPHFLYNALNSLAELIHQDPQSAEDAVVKMSTFLRNTMTETPMISLKEELRNASDYIDLENIRFEGNISLAIESDVAVQNVLVPKFSIQLLCENAIKHGMINAKIPFAITIRCFKNETVSLEVSNSGRAITKSTFGIGLSNLQERLRYLVDGQITITHYDPPTYLITLKGAV
jgi:two-component system, LytTR family, sensor kinase